MPFSMHSHRGKSARSRGLIYLYLAVLVFGFSSLPSPMAAFEWPPDDELKGLFRPPPISNPPTIRDLSNVFHLKRDLFQVSGNYTQLRLLVQY